MSAETLTGNSVLFDPSRGVVMRGEIRLHSDGKRRSEIFVTNDETGLSEHLVFESGSTWIAVLQMIQAVHDTHTLVDVNVAVVDGTQGNCTACEGLGEYADDEGNWHVCQQCGGRL